MKHDDNNINIGKVIKSNRINKKITQASLADGICSIPHLSKIENGSKEVNEETLNLLLNRLGISKKNLYVQSKELSIKLSTFIKDIVFLNKKNYKKTYAYLKNNEEQFHNSYLVNLYDLVLLHFYLVEGKIEEVDMQRKKIAKSINVLTPSEISFHYFLEGVYCCKKLDYVNAQVFFKKSEFKVLDEIRAELYYYAGLSSSKNKEYGAAIMFANKAIETYKEDLNSIRGMHSMMLLGIILIELNAVSEAKEYIEDIIFLSRSSEENGLLAAASHNMAIINKKQGDYLLGIDNLTLSLDIYKKLSIYRLHSLSLMSELYILVNDKELATYYLNKTIECAKSLQNTEIQYEAEYSLLKLSENKVSLKEYIENVYLPYCKEKEDKYNFKNLLKDLLKLYIQMGNSKSDYNDLLLEYLELE